MLTFLELPRVIWVHIGQFLSIKQFSYFVQTCTTLRQLAVTPSAWPTSVSLSTTDKKLLVVLSNLARYTQLQRLALRFDYGVRLEVADLEGMINTFKLLKHLVHFQYMGREVFIARLLSALPSLKSVERYLSKNFLTPDDLLLRDYFRDNSHVRVNALCLSDASTPEVEIAAKLQGIKGLALVTSVPQYTTKTLCLIAPALQNLTVLILHVAVQCDDSVIKALNLLSKKLSSFHLIGAAKRKRARPLQSPIQDVHLIELKSYFEHVKTMTWEHLDLVTGDTVFAGHYQHLTVLKLDDLPLFNDTGLQELCQLPALKNVKLSRLPCITSKGFSRISKHKIWQRCSINKCGDDALSGALLYLCTDRGDLTVNTISNKMSAVTSVDKLFIGNWIVSRFVYIHTKSNLADTQADFDDLITWLNHHNNVKLKLKNFVADYYSRKELNLAQIHPLLFHPNVILYNFRAEQWCLSVHDVVQLIRTHANTLYILRCTIRDCDVVQAQAIKEAIKSSSGMIQVELFFLTFDSLLMVDIILVLAQCSNLQKLTLHCKAIYCQLLAQKFMAIVAPEEKKEKETTQWCKEVVLCRPYPQSYCEFEERFESKAKLLANMWLKIMDTCESCEEYEQDDAVSDDDASEDEEEKIPDVVPPPMI